MIHRWLRLAAGALAVAALLIAGLGGRGPISASAATGPDPVAGSANRPVAVRNAQTDAYLTLLNNYRAQNGLGAVQYDGILQNAANWMSQDTHARCLEKGIFNGSCSGIAVHTDSLGRDIKTRLGAFNYPVDSTYIGEIITAGTTGVRDSAQQAFDAWRNSPDHDKIMRGANYTAIGISQTCTAAGCTWTADFGSKVVQALPATTPPPASGGLSYTRWYQTALNQIINAGLTVDGLDGPKTIAAVKTFQGARGLVVDGIVGGRTEAALLAAGAVQPPQRKSANFTRWIQSALNQVDNAGLAVDGIFGPKTLAAVKAFQTKRGLGVDGIVGGQTESAIVAAGARKYPN